MAMARYVILLDPTVQLPQLITLQLIGWYGFTQLHCSWLVEMVDP